MSLLVGMILYSCSLYEITEGELLSAVLMTLLDSFSGLMTAICLALITVGWYPPSPLLPAASFHVPK